MKIKLTPKTNVNVLDQIYSNPESFFVTAEERIKEEIKILGYMKYTQKDNSYKTRSEISELVVAIIKRYIKSLLMDSKANVNPYMVKTYNGRDLLNIIVDNYIHDDNSRKIISTAKTILKDQDIKNVDLYMEDVYEYQNDIFINLVPLSLAETVSKIRQESSDNSGMENFVLGEFIKIKIKENDM